jgi:hypothetical protein
MRRLVKGSVHAAANLISQSIIRGTSMSLETGLIIVVVVFVLGGGGRYWGRGRA